MALTKAPTEPAGINQPHSSSTSSGIPATAVVITGRASASASMSTTGRPSAKLGSTNAVEPVASDVRLQVLAKLAVADDRHGKALPQLAQAVARGDQQG
jgi:hypothetical protein